MLYIYLSLFEIDSFSFSIELSNTSVPSITIYGNINIGIGAPAPDISCDHIHLVLYHYNIEKITMYNNTDDYQQLYQCLSLTAKILVETFTMMEIKMIIPFPPDVCRAN